VALKDDADRRAVTHRNMVKLQLLVRETLADSSGSDDDNEFGLPENEIKSASNRTYSEGQPPLLQRSLVRGGYVEPKSNNLLQDSFTPNSLLTKRIMTASDIAVERHSHIDFVESPSTKERTPELSTVPDTPREESWFGTDAKPGQDRGKQRRSNLLRTALHAAAASALGRSGV
jgi:hypothetical protein